MTYRRCECPEEDRTTRIPMSSASTRIVVFESRWMGCTSKRTIAVPSRSNARTLNAWSEEVRAPVSIFALMAGMPSSGSETHSLQPTVVRSGRLIRLMNRLPYPRRCNRSSSRLYTVRHG